MTRWLRATIGLLCVALAGAGCDSSADTASTPSTSTSTATSTPTTTSTSVSGPPIAAVRLPLPAPAGDRFYVPPDPLPGRPGDVIWFEPFAGSNPPARRVLYRSSAADGSPIAVSGVAWLPTGEAPPGGRPIVTIAHGTTGLGDSWVSRRPNPVAAYLSQLLDEGYAVVASDYPGLGTPGVHPYLVGASEGRAVLDMARAARSLPDLQAGNRVVVMGHSQGGHSALFAGELAGTAPELDVAGVVALAPVAELAVWGAARRPESLGFLMMILAGHHAADPSLPVEAVLTPRGIQALGEIGDQCAGEIIARFSNQEPAGYFSGLIADSPPWRSAIEQSTPGRQRSGPPVLIVHGTNDPTVPAILSELLVPNMCRAGSRVDRRTYPDATHISVLTVAGSDVLSWVRARVAGEPAASECPTG